MRKTKSVTSYFSSNVRKETKVMMLLLGEKETTEINETKLQLCFVVLRKGISPCVSSLSFIICDPHQLLHG